MKLTPKLAAEMGGQDLASLFRLDAKGKGITSVSTGQCGSPPRHALPMHAPPARRRLRPHGRSLYLTHVRVHVPMAPCNHSSFLPRHPCSLPSRLRRQPPA